MKLPIYQVDAFTSKLFGGNPAAVCPLESWLEESVLQSIAAENNLAETAFFVKKENYYELRWFTPEAEVDLCGHATLASAFVIFHVLKSGSDKITFQTQSGILEVTKRNELLVMNFPSRKPVETEISDGLIEAIGKKPKEVLQSRDLLLVYETEEDILSLQPDFSLLKKINCFGYIATAKGNKVDFVSRFFAPKEGINEDPVTGSSHSTLIPFWAERLGKNELLARQISKRGGELFCKLLGDRVEIAGNAVLYLTGTIDI
ncbi:MAG: PhzF family phenazine biosynthesis protein [Ignavibacteria bacterium]|nr:PhzF family phenazine biosynthesis protein [Ignavibacteria bacterium]